MGNDSAVDVLNKRLSPEINYTQKFENDSLGRAIYIGFAEPGSATSDPKWQIRKQTKDSIGAATDIQFANGENTFDKIWDDRASYSYS